jgi:hypothetical protein
MSHHQLLSLADMTSMTYIIPLVHDGCTLSVALVWLVVYTLIQCTEPCSQRCCP